MGGGGGGCSCSSCSLLSAWMGFNTENGSSRVTSAGWQAEAWSTLAEGAFAACIPLGEPGGGGGSDRDPKDALLNVAG